jgi:regulator of sigma D
LKLVLIQVNIETKDEKYCTDRLEKGLVVVYEKILKSALTTEFTKMKNIDHIVQKIDQYKQEIMNLWEQLIPTIPPEVKEKRKHEETRKMDEMERQVYVAANLFNKHT